MRDFNGVHFSEISPTKLYFLPERTENKFLKGYLFFFKKAISSIQFLFVFNSLFVPSKLGPVISYTPIIFCAILPPYPAVKFQEAGSVL